MTFMTLPPLAKVKWLEKRFLVMVNWFYYGNGKVQ